MSSVETSGYGGEPTSGMMLSIMANDYNQLADRRYIGTLIGGVAFLSGTTLKAALTTIVAYIPGASLSASQVDGPTFSDDLIVYSQMVRQTLDQLTTLTGYVWNIDSNKKLRMYAPGDIAAPFSITDGDGHTIGDITTKPMRDDFANRVFVLGSGVIGTAEDAVSVAAVGDHEYAAQSDDITDQTQADNLAATILAEKLQTLTEVTYSTRGLGLSPGQTQSIANTYRGISGTYTLTQVNTEYFSGSEAIRHVTAIEGSTFKATWRQKTALMFSGSSNSGAVTILPSTTSSSGGGSSSVRLLAVLTASSSSTLDFTTRNRSGASGAIFQTDFDDYEIRFVGVAPSNNGVDFKMRVSYDGGSTWRSTSGDYLYATVGMTNQPISFTTNDSTYLSTSWHLTEAVHDGTTTWTSTSGVDGFLRGMSLASAVQHKFLSDVMATVNAPSGRFMNRRTAGWMTGTTAINAMRFYFSTGTILSGEIRIYGIAK
ncbi:MAG: hypothetical protein U0Q11_13890 [Vicinamibacterales bacterium]